MASYSSAQSRAHLVDALLAAQLALWSLRTIGALWTAVSPYGELSMVFARGARLSAPFLVGLFFATAIALLAWADRCARNLPALGQWRPFLTGDLVGAFFAPLFNVVTVPWSLYCLWRATDPIPPRHGWLMTTWWGSLMLALGSARHAALASALMVASAASLIAIVRDAQRRQDEQFADLELRGALPTPTAGLR